MTRCGVCCSAYYTHTAWNFCLCRFVGIQTFVRHPEKVQIYVKSKWLVQYKSVSNVYPSYITTYHFWGDSTHKCVLFQIHIHLWSFTDKSVQIFWKDRNWGWILIKVKVMTWHERIIIKRLSDTASCAAINWAHIEEIFPRFCFQFSSLLSSHFYSHLIIQFTMISLYNYDNRSIFSRKETRSEM